MNISFSVTYNERRLRRVITFLVGRQLKWLRVMGVVAAVAGVAALATEFLSDSTGTFFIAMGLILAVLLEPFSVAQSMRVQNIATRGDYMMTLEEAHVAVNAHSYS